MSSNPDTIYLIFEKLFSGFGFSMFIVFALLLFKSEATKEFYNKFIHYAIQVIKILGIAYFIYYLIRIITLYSIDELFFNERATGSYAWSYWMIMLRPFIFCLLTQLFWFKKIKKSKKRVFILTLLIFLFVFASGPNMERLIILLTTYHRDYLPSSEHLGPLSDNSNIALVYLLLIIENTLLFSGVVFVMWFLSERLKK